MSRGLGDQFSMFKRKTQISFVLISAVIIFQILFSLKRTQDIPQHSQLKEFWKCGKYSHLRQLSDKYSLFRIGAYQQIRVGSSLQDICFNDHLVDHFLIFAGHILNFQRAKVIARLFSAQEHSAKRTDAKSFDNLIVLKNLNIER